MGLDFSGDFWDQELIVLDQVPAQDGGLQSLASRVESVLGVVRSQGKRTCFAQGLAFSWTLWEEFQLFQGELESVRALDGLERTETCLISKLAWVTP